MIQNLDNQVYIKRDGDCSGQPVAIENCQNSLILILDNLASITVDDCKNCLLVLGPCQGSIFIRDCTDCVLLTACQQFRSRDCTMKVGLFCSTAPIIEETKAEIYPLFVDYPKIEDQMQRASLHSKANEFKDVQDFTPDISQLQINDEPMKLNFRELWPSLDVESVLDKEGVTFGKRVQ